MKILPFLAAAFALACTGLAAQNNCTCHDFNKTEARHYLIQDDSTALFQYTHKQRISAVSCAALALSFEVEYFMTHKNYVSALEVIKEQEKLIGNAPCADLKILNLLNYSAYYKGTEDYENLSLYAFKALEDAEKRKNSIDEYRAITFVVYLFTRQNQKEKNWLYIQRVVKIFSETDQFENKAADINWLAFEFETRFTETQRMPLLDSAIAYARIAKAEATKNQNFEQIVKSLRVLESGAYHKDSMRQAVAYLDSALYFAKKIKKPKNLSPLYLAKAWDHLDLGEKQEAVRWMDTCLFYTKKSFGNTLSSMNIYFEASNIYEGAGDMNKALKAFKFYEHLKDSLFKVQRTEKINELEQQYNKAKNERTIKELAQEKQIYLLMAVAGFFAVTAIAFYLRQQSLKHKKDILETEQRLNRARMNPHFFFNALTALQKFALTGADGNAMASNLSRFSHIMRETLESTYKEYVTIEQEIEFLREYLEVQKIRFPQAFSFEIQANQNLDVSDLLIPAMIIQPFVENSIEHGFSGIDHAGDRKSVV